MKVWESQKDWGAIMRKIIIIIEIATLIILLSAIRPEEQIKTTEAKELKYYDMVATAYTRHPNCISGKYDDGFTATMTPIREGIVAINVDYVDGEWQIKSPLRLGQNIYIEGLGSYSVEDTGRFAERDHKQDMWTLDIYMEDYEKAVKFGRQLKRVFILNN